MELTLIRPSADYAAEIEAFRKEYLETKAPDDNFDGCQKLEDYDDVLAWVEFCKELETVETARGGKYTRADLLMLTRVGERKILGLINLRHKLATEKLQKYSGHIGYCVLPSERRKGYAKAMLALCLERARELNIDKVLITCKTTNEASRRTILALGGVFEGEIGKEGEDVILERYWVKL